MSSSAPWSLASALARSTARNDVAEPSVPTTIILYELIKASVSSSGLWHGPRAQNRSRVPLFGPPIHHDGVEFALLSTVWHATPCDVQPGPGWVHHRS